MANPVGAQVWYDGKIVPWAEATVHATQIGPASVSSVFEGIRGYWNAEQNQLYIFQLDAHLARFMQSIRLTRVENPFTREQLRDAVVELARANEVNHDVYIRPFAYAEASTFGAPPSGAAHVIIHTEHWPSKLKSDRVGHAVVTSWNRIGDNVMPPRIKASANYLNSRYASEEAKRHGYDAAIILNPNGKVAEGPGACVMLARHGKLITPAVTSGILESITRETMIQIGREMLGLEVIEREVDRTELYVADEAFFCGTGIELMPLVSVDRFTIGDGQRGPITQQIADCYHDLVRGTDSHHPEWRTAV